MCNFCILFDWSSARARVSQGVATIDRAPENIPFLPEQQFNFCPMCGSPREATSSVVGDRFRYNLRKIRRMRGLTQEALGRSLGVKRAAISKYENGRTKPNVAQLSKLCKALDVSPQELI